MKTTGDSSGSYGRQPFSLIDRLTIQRRVALARSLVEEAVQEREQPAAVLELGCGMHGLNLQMLHAAFPAVDFAGVDTDVTPNPPRGVALTAADITRWEPDRQYDVVLSLAVVEHLAHPGQHFRLIARCLKPGGRALLTSPTPPNHAVWGTLADLKLIHAVKREHLLYLTQAGIERLAQEAGLAVVRYRIFQWGLNQSALLCRPEAARA